jgi:hypothetical protein
MPQLRGNEPILRLNSARHVTTSKSHSRRDDHGNDRKSRSMSKCHHSPEKSIRRAPSSSWLGSSPSVSLVKTPTFNDEHKKG